jgi:co-chaperonin GroES (HSP10)
MPGSECPVRSSPILALEAQLLSGAEEAVRASATLEYPEWVIDEPRPPELVIDPLDDYVVIQPSDEETETRAGLIIPASAENSCRSGVVTAVGNDADTVEPGDKVLFPKDAGYEVRLAGTAIRVIRRRELIARIHD